MMTMASRFPWKSRVARIQETKSRQRVNTMKTRQKIAPWRSSVNNGRRFASAKSARARAGKSIAGQAHLDKTQAYRRAGLQNDQGSDGIQADLAARFREDQRRRRFARFITGEITGSVLEPGCQSVTEPGRQNIRRAVAIDIRRGGRKGTGESELFSEGVGVFAVRAVRSPHNSVRSIHLLQTRSRVSSAGAAHATRAYLRTKPFDAPLPTRKLFRTLSSVRGPRANIGTPFGRYVHLRRAGAGVRGHDCRASCEHLPYS